MPVHCCFPTVRASDLHYPSPKVARREIMSKMFAVRKVLSSSLASMLWVSSFSSRSVAILVQGRGMQDGRDGGLLLELFPDQVADVSSNTQRDDGRKSRRAHEVARLPP